MEKIRKIDEYDDAIKRSVTKSYSSYALKYYCY